MAAARRRRACCSVARRRPALADRVHGHAARAADHAGPAGRRRRRPGRPRSGSAAGRGGSRRLLAPAVGRDRGPGRHRGRPGRRRRRRWPSPTGRGLPSCSSCRPAARRHAGSRRRRSPARCGRSRTPTRWRPWPRPRRPPTGSPPQLVAGEIPLIGRTEAEVSADIGRRLVAEGHQQVNFAIVGSGPNSASPHHDAGPRRHRPRRGGGLRLRRHHGRLLLGHHPHRVHRRPAGRVRGPLRRAPGGPGRRGGRGRGGHALRGGRRRGPAHHRRRRLRRRTSSTAPVTASASRSTRTPTSWAATTSRWRPATPSRSSPASTCPGASAPASRTSWSPRRRAPTAQLGRPRPGRRRGLAAMDLGIAGKVALVTAASKGLGRASAAGPGRRRRQGRDLRPGRGRPAGTPRPRSRSGRRGAGRWSPTSPSPTHRPGWSTRRPSSASGASTSWSANAGGPPPGRALEITDERDRGRGQRQPDHLDPAGPRSAALDAPGRLGPHLPHHLLRRQAAHPRALPCPTWPAPASGRGPRRPLRTFSPTASPSTWRARAATPPTA